jgi:Flp pilus assembly protein TadG
MKKPDERGVSAVEFALLLPVLVLILFGIIEFGMYIYNLQVLTNASREGARAGIVYIDSTHRTQPSAIQTVVQNYCADHMVTFGTPDPTYPKLAQPTTVNDSAAFGTNLTVEVQYIYDFLIIPNFIPGVAAIRDMRAVTIMRYE